jgi:putative protease
MTKSSFSSLHYPELLLPVGNENMCLAAIHNGADAVYIGVPQFNARGRGQDFSLPQLKEMIDLCHLYGVKVHLALNVLIFEQEIATIHQLLYDLIALGPDAFIVQDLGLASLIRAISPDMVLHGSTQMTVTNAEAMDLLEDLSLKRFVLGREVSMKEMKLIQQQTDKELEVFVHGALCVAYSGQCFTSEGIGGRSANRGQCAQSCRLPYDLIVDGVKKDLGDKRYLVSPQDLCGLDEVPELIKIGIQSFKIEGRLKSPEYVAQTAQAYYQARSQELTSSQKNELTDNLAKTYSRGLFSGWLHGVDHQQLVEGTYSAHRGLKCGTVIKKEKFSLHIETEMNLVPGQGLLFVWENKEIGAKITKVTQRRSQQVEVSLWTVQGKLSMEQQIPLQASVYLNSDAQLDKQLQQSFQLKEKQKKIPLNFVFSGKEGTPLTLKVSDGQHNVVVESPSLLVKAEQTPLKKLYLQEIFSALGGSCYKADQFKWEALALKEQLFLHQRELKTLKKMSIDQLNQLRMQPKIWTTKPIQPSLSYQKMNLISDQKQLNLLLRKKNQVISLLDFVEKYPSYRGRLGNIILDYEFGKDYESSIQLLRKAGLCVGMATTRILKPQEHHHLKLIERLNPDMILVRNLGALAYFKNRLSSLRLHGDFSLNATNHMTVDYLIGKGLSCICASYDLSASQLKDLLAFYSHDCSQIEVTLHQYLPLFHMEHCVYAAFMSTGSSFRDCGRPCEKHHVELKDYYGNTHVLKADAECRNTMFQGKAQSAAFVIEELIKLGVQQFRLEFLDEEGELFQQKIMTYSQLLHGERPSPQILKSLNTLEHYGVHEGTLIVKDPYKDRKKSS